MTSESRCLKPQVLNGLFNCENTFSSPKREAIDLGCQQ